MTCAHNPLAETFRSFGTSVSISLQPSKLEETGELWTVSAHRERFYIGQGSTLEAAMAAYTRDITELAA